MQLEKELKKINANLEISMNGVFLFIQLYLMEKVFGK